MSNPASPVLLAEIQTSVGGFNPLNHAESVAVSGTTAYVTSPRDSSLTIIDVANLIGPGLIVDQFVGIGTSTPRSALDVKGTVMASAFVGDVTGNVSGSAASFTGSLSGDVTGPQGATVIANGAVTAAKLGSGVGLWSVSGANVYRNSGNVGIGTTIPDSALMVAGGLNSNTLVQGVHLGMNDGYNVGMELVAAPGYGALIDFKDADIPGNDYGVRLQYNSVGNNLEVRGATSFHIVDGNVGIGTTSPTQAKLVVNGNVSTYLANFYFLTDVSGYPGTRYTGNEPLSIYASDRISGSGFDTHSDERIKTIKGPSNSADDLGSLLQIQITDYTFKDKIAKGERPQKKVIAQQVEKVYPQAVNRSTNTVPDIYQPAPIADGWIELATDLKVGERVKLIAEKEEGIHEVLEVADGRFRTEFKPAGDKVFVYGREVDDFRSVDYEAIAMLNVSATQELARKLAAQQAENTALQKQLAELKAKDQARDAKDEARDAKLAAIEALLRSRTAPAMRTAAPAATAKVVKVALKK